MLIAARGGIKGEGKRVEGRGRVKGEGKWVEGQGRENGSRGGGGEEGPGWGERERDGSQRGKQTLSTPPPH